MDIYELLKQKPFALDGEQLNWVKEEKGVLSLTPERYKKLLVYPIERNGGKADFDEKEPCGRQLSFL